MDFVPPRFKYFAMDCSAMDTMKMAAAGGSVVGDPRRFSEEEPKEEYKNIRDAQQSLVFVVLVRFTVGYWGRWRYSEESRRHSWPSGVSQFDVRPKRKHGISFHNLVTFPPARCILLVKGGRPDGNWSDRSSAGGGLSRVISRTMPVRARK